MRPEESHHSLDDLCSKDDHAACRILEGRQKCYSFTWEMNPENLPPSTAIIRPMESSDLDFVRKGLCEIAWQDLPLDHKLLVTRSENEKLILQEFEARMADPKRRHDYFVAELGGSPVGFVGLGEFIHPEIGIHFGLIADLWTAPEFREQGIGGLLLDHGIRFLKSKGYKR